MDKNHHVGHILGGTAERIGDWTPQQLTDYIQGQIANDPNMMPNVFRAKGIDVDNIRIGGRQLHHAVSRRALTMGDGKGKPTPAWAMMSGTAVINQAYHDVNPGVNKLVFAESFDSRLASGGSSFGNISGTGRLTAIYVPTRQRLTNMRVNYSQFEAGGTFTYGGYAIYGPVRYDLSGAAMNITSLPQVAITETNTVNNFRAAGTHFVSNGLHAMGTPWNVVVEPGIYFVVMLYVFSVAPGTTPEWLVQAAPTPGIVSQNLASPGIMMAGVNAGMATLPATLSLSPYSATNTAIWYDFYDDKTASI